MKQMDFASLLEIDRAYLSRVENCHVEPSIRLLKLAERVAESHKNDIGGKSAEVDPAVLALLEESKEGGIPDEQLLGAAVAESVSRYGSKLEDNPVLAELFERMKRWQEAAAKDPAKAGFMLQIFKKYMPDEDLHL